MKPGFYTIPLTGLKEGEHHYDFEIDDDFFEGFEDSEIKKGDLVAKVILVKRSAHMELTIRLEGTVEVMCDRCLEYYRQQLKTENGLFIKYGSQWEEVDDKVLIIPYGESELEIGQFLYEFSHLGLPLQRIHPEGKKGKSSCDPEMIKRINSHKTEISGDNDPRWDKLTKLRDNILN